MITDPTKRAQFFEKGLNPDEFDEIQPLVELPPEQQKVPNTSSAPQTSTTEALATHAAKGILPSLGAIGSGAAAGAGLGALGMNPVTTLLGGIGGSILGGAATTALQEKILDYVAPEFAKNLKEKEL